MNVTETSNLFSKCDSWNHLSSHDKESFTLMNSWLHNSNGIEEILKNLPIKSESVQKNSSTASKTTSNKRKICAVANDSEPPKKAQVSFFYTLYA